jgi:GIY-YIG catalytic domain-containing protein
MATDVFAEPTAGGGGDGARVMAATVRDAAFPQTSGAYAVWGDGDRPLYVGMAATQTLAQRWRRQHLRPRAGGSALRRTLGVRLGLVAEKLRRPERYYPAEVEAAITDFLLGCRI